MTSYTYPWQGLDGIKKLDIGLSRDGFVSLHLTQLSVDVGVYDVSHEFMAWDSHLP